MPVSLAVAFLIFYAYHIRVTYFSSVTSTFNSTSRTLVQKLSLLSGINYLDSGSLVLFMQRATPGPMSTNPGH